MAWGWFYSPSQIGRYIITRVTSLKPPRVRCRIPGPVSPDRVADVRLLA